MAAALPDNIVRVYGCPGTPGGPNGSFPPHLHGAGVQLPDYDSPPGCFGAAGMAAGRSGNADLANFDF